MTGHPVARGGKGFTHERPYVGSQTVWLTPPEIVAALGPFDLDPCAATDQPWRTAARHYTEADDGLQQPWHGFVWCNPPFGPGVDRWLDKLARHGSGIALVPARTETRWFITHVWRAADGALFVHGRLRFYDAQGQRAKSTIATPVVLVAYGKEAIARLRSGAVKGTFVTWGNPRRAEDR